MSNENIPAVEIYDRVTKDCLRKKWSTMKSSGINVQWEDLRAFVAWCAETGWHYEMRLKRKDLSGPFGPENCYWEEAKSNPQVLEQMAKQWEAGVGPIREKLRPYLDAIAPKKAAPVEVFRYEHPDLVREGIVWKEGAPTEEF